MSVLFVNIPFFKKNDGGILCTGPNAGSRWPFTHPYITDYAPFPFFMAYAVSYLRAHGHMADYYDGVAMGHWDDKSVKREIRRRQPEIVFLETSTPVYWTILKYAQWIKEELGARVVLTGPHIHTFYNKALENSFVDHCIVGEYEKPALEIVERGDKAERVYIFDHLDQVDTVRGENFLPFHDFSLLHRYWEPTMGTPLVQLAVNTSRGCPFKCTYCQWPKAMNNGCYRKRNPELVLDEIQTVINRYNIYLKEAPPPVFSRSRIALANQNLSNIWRSLSPNTIYNTWSNLRKDLSGSPVGSIFFDDDTWNLGKTNITAMCRGLKEIGLPWSMMGRVDACDFSLYDLMVDSGCVGMRFGVESFQQRLLDNVKKRMDARRNLEGIKYLITRFSGMEFHFTTMFNLPGETEQDRRKDIKTLDELKKLGRKSGNRIHWQSASCIPFPGTELWEELVAAGKGAELDNFDLYDGKGHNEETLAQAVGWLGENYQPKWSKYSGLGEPTDREERS